jgi:tetratricopeptide (TPR) repeat protein
MIKALLLMYYLDISLGVVFLCLALPQIFARKVGGAHAIRLLTTLVFVFLVAGVAFAKYLAGTAPRYLTKTEQSNPPAAISAYTRAIRVDPGNAQLYFRRGATNLVSGHYGEAIADYTKALEIEPTNPDFLIARGMLFAKLHDAKSAGQDLDKAASQYVGKKTPEALTQMAMIAQFQPGGVDSVITFATQALEAKPNSSDRCDALLYRANAYLSRAATGDGDNALRDSTDAEKACEGPAKATSFFYQGIAQELLHEYEPALAAWNRDLELEPDDWGALYSRGMLLAEIGRPDAALSDLNRVIDLQPNNPAGYRGRAKIYSRLGEQKLADSDLQKADALAERNSPGFPAPTIFSRHLNLPWEQILPLPTKNR